MVLATRRRTTGRRTTGVPDSKRSRAGAGIRTSRADTRMAGSSPRSTMRETVSWLTRSRSATSLIVYHRGSDIVGSCVVCVPGQDTAEDAGVNFGSGTVRRVKWPGRGDLVSRWRALLDRLPGAREQRWVDAARKEFAFLAELGLTETELKFYVTGPMLTFDGPGRGFSLNWESDGIGVLDGYAWRDPDRGDMVILSKLVRRQFPDAPLPPGDIRDIGQALAATSLLARQAAQVLPSFADG
jgi:hypothetical protein